LTSPPNARYVELPENAIGQFPAVQTKAAATALILVGLFVEVFMSAGVISGIADRGSCSLATLQ
jgi:hypothetical protein